MTEPAHRCHRFREARREGTWRDAGLLRERDVLRVMRCAECGRERPARVRKPVAVEREARSGTAAVVGPVADAALRGLAARLAGLARTRAVLRAGPLVRRLGGVRAEADLERLAACAPLRLVYRPSGGGLLLSAVRLLDGRALEEVAHPGAAARRGAVLAEARRATAPLCHPESKRIAGLLAADHASQMDERLIRALTGLARLVDDGDVRPARAFSSEVLGHSKALAAIRPRLERLLGPLERLGVRDSGALVLVGGEGRLRLPTSDVDVGRFRWLGLAAPDVSALESVLVPDGGLLVVENLTPFRACADRLAGHGRALLVWSGGFPGRAVTTIVEHAAARGARIRVWCDTDLGGVRIARLIHRATAGRAEPVLMDPSLVRAAGLVCPLTAAQRRAITRDLADHPDALLADTLRAVLDRDAWVEQEALLDRLGAILP